MPFLGRPTIMLYCVVGLDESTPFEEDIKADNSLLVAYAPRSLFFFARGGRGPQTLILRGSFLYF